MLKQLSVREKGESGVWGLLAELLRSGCIADGPEVSEIKAEARRCVFAHALIDVPYGPKERSEARRCVFAHPQVGAL